MGGERGLLGEGAHRTTGSIGYTVGPGQSAHKAIPRKAGLPVEGNHGSRAEGAVVDARAPAGSVPRVEPVHMAGKGRRAADGYLPSGVPRHGTVAIGEASCSRCLLWAFHNTGLSGFSEDASAELHRGVVWSNHELLDRSHEPQTLESAPGGGPDCPPR